MASDTRLDLFTISSRQSSTDNESHLKVKFCAALPRRNCKQSEPSVMGHFFLGIIEVVFVEIILLQLSKKVHSSPVSADKLEEPTENRISR